MIAAATSPAKRSSASREGDLAGQKRHAEPGQLQRDLYLRRYFFLSKGRSQRRDGVLEVSFTDQQQRKMVFGSLSSLGTVDDCKRMTRIEIRHSRPFLRPDTNGDQNARLIVRSSSAEHRRVGPKSMKDAVELAGNDSITTVERHQPTAIAQLTGANRNDSQQALALVDAIPHLQGERGRPRHGPDCVGMASGSQYASQIRWCLLPAPSLGSISSAVCVCAMKSGLTSMKHFWPWRALSSAGRHCKGTAEERLGEQTCFIALLASSR